MLPALTLAAAAVIHRLMFKQCARPVGYCITLCCVCASGAKEEQEFSYCGHVSTCTGSSRTNDCLMCKLSCLLRCAVLLAAGAKKDEEPSYCDISVC